jgi:hypothetical protein
MVPVTPAIVSDMNMHIIMDLSASWLSDCPLGVE